MKKTFRKRKADDSEPDEDPDEATTQEHILRQVEEARKRQKLRSKQVLEAGKIKEKPVKPEEEEQAGLQECDTFGAQFTEGRTPWGGIEHENKMKEYIETKLSERRGPLAAAAATEQTTVQVKSIDELALEGHGHEDLKLTTEPIEDANRWLTGIQEVQLPIEYKIRNIEDTEDARKRAMVAARHGKDPTAPKVPVNVPKGFHSRFVVGQQARGIAQIADQTKSVTDGQGKAKGSKDDAAYTQYVSEFLERVQASKDRAAAHTKK